MSRGKVDNKTTTKEKKKPPVKKNITCYVDSEILEEWRTMVKENGKFFSGAMEESMKLWISKYKI